MSLVSECYRTLTTPFGAKGPYYDPVIGHRGADYRRLARQSVIAYESGVVEVVSSSGGLGRVLGMKLDKGGFAGWAHLYYIRVKVGQRVKAGDVLAYVAGYGDAPGSLWDGAHIHTTLSTVSSWAAAFGITPGLIDPAPRIRAAVASSIAGDGLDNIIEGDPTVKTYASTDFRATGKPGAVGVKLTAAAPATRIKNANGTDRDITNSGDDGLAISTVHVYGKATPGESVDVLLVYFDIEKNRGSNHYVERCVADDKGVINANVTFQRTKATGWRIYAQAQRPSSNTGDVTISLFAADAAIIG